MEIERLENSPENFRRLRVKALSLQSELDEAESQLNDMRETYLNAEKLWPAFMLSPAEMLIFSLLMDRPHATRGMIHKAMDFRRIDHRQDYTDHDRKLIDTIICKMRRRLKPYGIEIKTVWGHGYQITGEMKAMAQAMSEGRARAITVKREDFVNQSGGFLRARVFSEYAE